jgi:hypothetical protein
VVDSELLLAIDLHFLVLPIMITRKEKMVVPPKKKRGRPFTGADNRDPVTAIRLSPQFRAAVDAWASGQDDKPPRSEAIRRLVQRGLASEGVEMPSPVAVSRTRKAKPFPAAPARSGAKKSAKATKAAPTKRMRQRRP